MKNNRILRKTIGAACAVCVATACTDWTETESIRLVENSVEQQDAERYALYVANLKTYKASDHKVVYGWFDNSEKTPCSRGQHLADVPDSLDVVVATDVRLTEAERAEVDELHAKGTRVFGILSYDGIRRAYDEAVGAEKETRDFADVLAEEVKQGLERLDPFDGLVLEYRGKSPIYMTAEQREETARLQQLLLKAVGEWKTGSGKHLAFFGYPAHLIRPADILPACGIIILPTEHVADKQEYGIEAMRALAADDVPADRFAVSASTVSLDATDKATGYVGTDRATTQAACWTTEPTAGIRKAGLAILAIQNDYYNATHTYQYVREAIQIMNPAPAK